MGGIELVVRKLRINELSLLFNLHQYNDKEEMLLKNSDSLKNGDIDIFGLFINDLIIGELRVKYRSEDELEAVYGKRAYLYAFRIHEEYQNKGYGTYLINEVLTSLEKTGYCEFTVGVEEDNERALHMYQKVGFITAIALKSETYQGDGYEYTLYLRGKWDD